MSKPTEPDEPGDSPDGTDTTARFHAVEYDALRREIELQISERRKAENQILISAAAVLAWILTRDKPIDPTLYRAALFVPVVLAGLGLLRWIGIQLRTITIGDYLKRVENELAAKGFGWEQHLARHRTSRPFVGRFEGWSEFLVWVALIVGAVALALFTPAPSSGVGVKRISVVAVNTDNLISVTDGDTVKLVHDDGKTERIRIENLDAPEVQSAKCPSERELGLLAGAAMVKLLRAAESVEILRSGEDRFGRTLARITIDGGDVGDAMIKLGFAKPWRGRSSNWCE